VINDRRIGGRRKYVFRERGIVNRECTAMVTRAVARSMTCLVACPVALGRNPD